MMNINKQFKNFENKDADDSSSEYLYEEIPNYNQH